MLLLAANTGFGNTDLANLPLKALDLDGGWVDFARVKNATPRRIPLWAETVKAIRAYLPNRPTAKSAADSRLTFLTRRGCRWVSHNEKGSPTDYLGQEFGKLLRELNLKRPGISVYALRHGFETVAGETADQVAVDSIMGHKPKGMAGVYRERIGDARLQRVTEYVRTWLFPPDDSELCPEKLRSEFCDPSDRATRARRNPGRKIARVAKTRAKISVMENLRRSVFSSGI